MKLKISSNNTIYCLPTLLFYVCFLIQVQKHTSKLNYMWCTLVKTLFKSIYKRCRHTSRDCLHYLITFLIRSVLNVKNSSDEKSVIQRIVHSAICPFSFNLNFIHKCIHSTFIKSIYHKCLIAYARLDTNSYPCFALYRCDAFSVINTRPS